MRRLDWASLALVVVGLACLALAYWAVRAGMDPLIMSPSIVAATIGATHMVKREAPR